MRGRRGGVSLEDIVALDGSMPLLYWMRRKAKCRVVGGISHGVSAGVSEMAVVTCKRRRAAICLAH